MNKKFHILCFMSLLTAFALQTSFAQIPTDGLVGYFMLDGNPVDSSGLANDGTIMDQVSPTMNRFGKDSKACLFEGGYINAGNPMDFQITEAISIAAWISPTSIDDWSGIITKWNSANEGIYLGINPDSNTLRWNIGGPQALDGDEIILGEWVHIVATYDGDSIKTFQDGILTSAASNSTSIIDNGENLIIGSQTNLLQFLFDGAIDDVLIYNRGLNQSGIDSIYNSQIISHIKDIIDPRSVELYPNPTNNILNVENNSEYQILSYTLCNAAGIELRTTDFQEALDIGNQPSGTYYLRINFDDGSMTKKVVKL